jgi:acetyltransferase
MTIRNLKYLFKPRSIAVIGAGKQPDGVDSALEFNLIEGGFKGPVMPVNPDRQSISGVLAYKDISPACRSPRIWRF